MFALKPAPDFSEAELSGEDYHSDRMGRRYPFANLQPGEAYAVPYTSGTHNYLRSRVVWASIRYGRRFRWKWRKPETEIIIWCEIGVDTEAGEA